ncbi:hypothetical protein AAC387_Pa03g4438 [Persea americana]
MPKNPSSQNPKSTRPPSNITSKRSNRPLQKTERPALPPILNAIEIYSRLPLSRTTTNQVDARDGNAKMLSWGHRLRIALDAAQGLEYLHTGCKSSVIHRDVKTANILLNGRLEAKIGDFGLSRNHFRQTASETTIRYPDDADDRIWSIWTTSSTLPPIFNAEEIFVLEPLSGTPTDSKDVDTIMNIKAVYQIKRNWMGDPCVPSFYIWEGLKCSYSKPPTIISLDLSSSGLTGVLAPSLVNFTSIQFLDVSNNSLTGPVPDFLAKLSSLKILKLTNNQFTGPIPAILLEKWKDGSLSLSVSMLYQNRQFTYAQVVSMTNNFEKSIGRGGFGTVYHGQMTNGTQVAVKMLFLRSIKTPCQGSNEFENEVQLLTRVHHRNLVSFIGYCQEDGNMALIYEYMAQGNLGSHLSDNCSNALSWYRRLRIALDVAQGLEYLHDDCKPSIIHRDVKTANILLNERLEAKIGDFGLSRVFNDEFTHVSTVVKGTVGYLDPEYCNSNNLTEKSDVYSFGVVLLQLITGKPAIVRITNSKRISLIDWVSLRF